MNLAEDLLSDLRVHANPDNVAGMARYGISTTGTLGVSMPYLRAKAGETKSLLGRKDEGLRERHETALALWASGLHEARILAALVDVPAMVSEQQAEAWVRDLDSWDVCDQLCGNLFDKTPLAREKVREWTAREEEFVKRAGFVLMTQLAVHDKRAPDELFLDFLPIIEREAGDGRNFVKKAVNWALRQIGKRSVRLHGPALEVAERLASSDDPARRWVGRGAAKELRSSAVLERLGLGG
ncbi:MAG: DNA alkylation repair protein [Actinomycetota bacterium]|nr:DNA alkylation repair protein [Actinomycetota bacterium]